MLINQIIYDAQTGETRIEQVEVPDVPLEPPIPQPPTIEERVESIEEANVNLVATSWDIDFRVCEIEWFLEDNIAPVNIRNTFNLKGVNTMALSRYEQAKIMILGGVYNDATLRRQLKTYLDRDYLTQEQYDELISMMDARLLVEGK